MRQQLDIKNVRTTSPSPIDTNFAQQSNFASDYTEETKQQPVPEKREQKRNSKFSLVIVTFIVFGVISVFAGYSLKDNLASITDTTGEEKDAVDYEGAKEEVVENQDKYKAVFLTNGQVYFGKITKKTYNEIWVEDIYYLQVSKELQGKDKNDEDSGSDMNLIKLGSEIHGPEDLMRINREHVLFIEDLKNDSEVVKTIQGR